MAGTGRTTNYGLALYEPDNTVSMLNTFNNNMNVIDAGMEANKVLAQSASDGTQANTTNIQKIETEIEAVKDNVANNTTDIDGLKVNYQTLAGKVVNAEGDIADLDATTTELTGKVNLNTTKIGENETEIGALQEQVNNLEISIPMPDSENVILSINDELEHTIEQDAYLGGYVTGVASTAAGTDGTAFVQVNGCIVGYCLARTATQNGAGAAFGVGVPIKKGAVIKFTKLGNWQTISSYLKVYGLAAN